MGMEMTSLTLPRPINISTLIYLLKSANLDENLN